MRIDDNGPNDFFVMSFKRFDGRETGSCNKELGLFTFTFLKGHDDGEIQILYRTYLYHLSCLDK